MKIHSKVFLALLQLLLVSRTYAATLYVDLNSASPTPPYATWHTAATNIQEAIDVATPGDLVLVTNGVYATGGKVMFGDLTNRVALDKAITVQSVNGPYFTTIRGNGATNGPAAVRCAWLTNGATLQGFTLTAGATRGSGDPTNTLAGGGALCLSTNALLQNCLVISNLAQGIGGGVFQGAVANSAILGNRSSGQGSGAAYATLLNCTVVSNWQSSATHQSRHTNSIVYHNISGNYSVGTFAYSCIQPAAGGVGNISTAPQLFPDAIHLLSTSPCRAAGTNVTTGFDLDGQTWANPPSIGCDEWREQPIMVTQPRLQLTNNPIGFSISVTAAGLEPFTCYWTRNGVPLENDGHYSSAHSTNLVATGVSELDAGAYQVVVSNAFGVATSSITNLIFRFVNGANAAPVAPYTSWSTAATNIQEAIDAAMAGEVVLVTNGIYGASGKGMGSDLTNRVALDKALLVQSVNGPEATIIEGNWNPTVTNGPSAVRCAWLTNNAILVGFTLRGGATRVSSADIHGSGGGVYGSSTNATLENCIISTNLASNQGGGAFQVALRNCTLVGNRAVGTFAGALGAGRGGGAYISHLQNCLIRANFAGSGDGGGASGCTLINSALTENSSNLSGSGAYGGRLFNCTVVNNLFTGSGSGGAVNNATLTNCIVWGNRNVILSANSNYSSCTFAYSCSLPVPSGPGNIALNPLLLADNVHVDQTSPCRAAGAAVASGVDFDNQPWASPPAMGCDEWTSAPFIAGVPSYSIKFVRRSLVWTVSATGQTPLSYTWFKDGNLIQNDVDHVGADSASLSVLKLGPEDAGNYSVIVSNSFGVATSQVVQVVIHCVDAAGSNPISPYSTWATATPSIQTAIDVANAGDIVLVTNGVYATGGKIMSGDLLNRVAIDKPLTVMSVNGYRETIIEGAWDLTSTNGPAAVRCVAMVDGAALAGFTIRNGATRTTGNTTALQSGGGVWSATSYGGVSVVNCLFTNNASGYLGGGIYGGAVKNSIFVGNYGNIGGNTGGGGGASANSDLKNCTVNYNFCQFPAQGAGVYGCQVYNSIVRGNYQGNSFSFENNYYPSFSPTFFAYSSSWPPPSGVSNTTMSPVFLDWDYHLPASSPVRGIGSPLYSSGEDVDGESWASPPSIGVDEVIEANLVGPISLSMNAWQTNTFVGSYHALTFWASITGRVSRIDWDFGDGAVITNVGHTSPIHWWTNTGTFIVTCTAYNTDNPSGVSAGIEIRVLPLVAPLIQAVSLDSAGFKFSFEAQESARYSVQYATNLAAPVIWNTLQSIFYSPGGTTQITDPAWTNSARFYRVLVQ